VLTTRRIDLQLGGEKREKRDERRGEKRDREGGHSMLFLSSKKLTS
jgi:hypothetical protein